MISSRPSSPSWTWILCAWRSGIGDPRGRLQANWQEQAYPFDMVKDLKEKPLLRSLSETLPILEANKISYQHFFTHCINSSLTKSGTKEPTPSICWSVSFWLDWCVTSYKQLRQATTFTQPPTNLFPTPCNSHGERNKKPIMPRQSLTLSCSHKSDWLSGHHDLPTSTDQTIH